MYLNLFRSVGRPFCGSKKLYFRQLRRAMEPTIASWVSRCKYGTVCQPPTCVHLFPVPRFSCVHHTQVLCGLRELSVASRKRKKGIFIYLLLSKPKALQVWDIFWCFYKQEPLLYMYMMTVETDLFVSRCQWGTVISFINYNYSLLRFFTKAWISELTHTLWKVEEEKQVTQLLLIQTFKGLVLSECKANNFKTKIAAHTIQFGFYQVL